jgi:hypothetical protein
MHIHTVRGRRLPPALLPLNPRPASPQVTIKGFRNYRDESSLEPFCPHHNLVGASPASSWLCGCECLFFSATHCD